MVLDQILPITAALLEDEKLEVRRLTYIYISAFLTLKMFIFRFVSQLA